MKKLCAREVCGFVNRAVTVVRSSSEGKDSSFLRVISLPCSTKTEPQRRGLNSEHQ